MDPQNGVADSGTQVEHQAMPDLFTIGNAFYNRRSARGCTCGWRSEFLDHVYQADEALRRHLSPGLHRTGPAPWDFEYNPAKGRRITFVGLDGRQFTGTIDDFSENRDTGELTISVEDSPDGLLG